LKQVMEQVATSFELVRSTTVRAETAPTGVLEEIAAVDSRVLW